MVGKRSSEINEYYRESLEVLKKTDKKYAPGRRHRRLFRVTLVLFIAVCLFALALYFVVFFYLNSKLNAKGRYGPDDASVETIRNMVYSKDDENSFDKGCVRELWERGFHIYLPEEWMTGQKNDEINVVKNGNIFVGYISGAASEIFDPFTGTPIEKLSLNDQIRMGYTEVMDAFFEGMGEDIYNQHYGSYQEYADDRYLIPFVFSTTVDGDMIDMYGELGIAFSPDHTAYYVSGIFQSMNTESDYISSFHELLERVEYGE